MLYSFLLVWALRRKMRWVLIHYLSKRVPGLKKSRKTKISLEERGRELGPRNLVSQL